MYIYIHVIYTPDLSKSIRTKLFPPSPSLKFGADPIVDTSDKSKSRSVLPDLDAQLVSWLTGGFGGKW